MLFTRLRRTMLPNVWKAASQKNRSYSATYRPLRDVNVAIVGSGPSGCYTAKYVRSTLEKDKHEVKIDVLDRLPTPFGLVRSGVAPDHPQVKNVQNDFAALFENETTSFFGNVTLGKDVSIEELRSLYDVVVLAYGSESDRKLGIEGEDTLSGILSAREFVAWYNGHPDFAHIGPIVEKALGSDPSKANVVVIGQGNVALDCARILAKGRAGLDHTDITSRALEVIKEGVAATTIVGRRGHIQGAFTIKELRELTKLDEYDATCVIRLQELEMGSTGASMEELETSRAKVRIDKLLRNAALTGGLSTASKDIRIRFLMNPVKFEPDDSEHDDDESDNLEPERVGKVVCEHTTLVGEPGKQRAIGTGTHQTFPADMVLVSIGYKAVAVDDELLDNGWFDEERGVVEHTGGKVDGPSDDLGGLYVVGWLKRGPSGIIATNIMDAKDTVAAIKKDIEFVRADDSRPKSGDLSALLRERNVRVVDWKGYQSIDAEECGSERRRNEEQPREKITELEELLRVASKP